MSTADKCIIVNEESEASFFIQKYQLKRMKKLELFPIFSNIEKRIWLTINVSKKYSNIIPIYLKNCSKAKLSTKWFFFTFSLDGMNELSKFFVIDEISNDLNGFKLYPSVTGLGKFLRKSVYSVSLLDTKCNFLQNKGSFEIYKTLQKISYRELIVMTSISIGYKQLSSKEKKITLIKKNFTSISNLFKSLDNFNLIVNSSEYLKIPFYQITKNFNFTINEKIILHKLLRKFDKNKLDFIVKDTSKLGSSKSIIYNIKKHQEQK